MRTFLGTCCTMATRGDILGNVILFIPIGFTGLLAARLGDSIQKRAVMFILTAACVALLLQLLQFFLPSRDENIQDALWNVFGTVVGASVAYAIGSFFSSPEEHQPEIALVPLTLVGAWLAYRLIPFVPSLDLQLIKDSVWPLFHDSINVVSVIHDFAAWIVVAFFLRHVQRDGRLDIYLPLIMIAVFSLEILIVYNSISWSNIVGAFLAIVVWVTVAKYLFQRPEIIIGLLSVALIVDGLAPFVPTANPASFNWLPFHGFLGGSMYTNAQSAVEKVFLYGSLVYLLWQIKLDIWVSILLGSSFVMLIELAQMYFMGHTPEITDPVLFILAALALQALDRPTEKSAPVISLAEGIFEGGADERSAGPKEPDISLRTEAVWVSQKTNLRQSQSDFLQKLATEMSVSVSRVTRRIVTQFLDGLEQNAGPGSDKSAQESASLRSLENIPGENGADAIVSGSIESGLVAEKWVNQSVNLRKEQHDFLLHLSREMDCSASRVVRRIIAHFIENLDNEGPINADTNNDQPS